MNKKECQTNVTGRTPKAIPRHIGDRLKGAETTAAPAKGRGDPVPSLRPHAART